MFVQFIVAEGVHDDILEVLERWEHDVRPGAIGWLGTTAGVTSEGNLIVAARFASEEEARRNSERREQAAWWEEAEKRMPGTVSFYDCTDVATMLGGGSDDAGFVQIMESRPPHPLDVQELADEMGRVMEDHRPDVLGVLVASDGDRLFQVVYFTSEEEARAAESKDLPPEVAAEVEENAALIGEVRFHDLLTPYLRS
jgi:hypothetical protein